MFNYGPTIAAALLTWDGKCWNWPAREQMLEMVNKNSKMFHNAYTVATTGQNIDKFSYVLNTAELVAAITVPRTTCGEAFRALRTIAGLGNFMAGQVIADLKNDRYLVDAPDKATFVAIGPGSKKGMDYLHGDASTKESNFLQRLDEVREALQGAADGIDNQDLQNVLCEFSKYARYVSGEVGRIRYYDRSSK
jgi:hypothetical protein